MILNESIKLSVQSLITPSLISVKNAFLRRGLPLSCWPTFWRFLVVISALTRLAE